MRGSCVRWTSTPRSVTRAHARSRIFGALAVALALAPVVAAPTASAAPPTEVADPAKQQAERSQVALGFDPTLARGSKVDTAAELGLEPQGDGSARYVDPLGRFSASFHADGTVTFADPWRRPSSKNPERGVCCGRPPRFSFPNFEMAGPVEWLMYMSDQEPLRREKWELLERTRDYRTQLAIEFARARIAEALDALEGDLREIWSDPTLTPAQRRKRLFERWDECDERFNIAPAALPDAAISVIDGERLQAAERARREIEAFVRSVAPEGSAQGYGAAELSELNAARLSQKPFAPYTPPPPPKQAKP